MEQTSRTAESPASQIGTGKAMVTEIFPTLTVIVRFLLLLVIGSGLRLYGALHPSFALDNCSWYATHIFLACSDGEQIDGNLVVLESWKGDLSPGDHIQLPELASFNSRESRVIKSSPERETGSPPQCVTGSRIVLFLRRVPTNVAENRELTGHQSSSSRVWQPASNVGMNLSLIWVEGDRTFGFRQLTLEEPSVLTALGKSEIEIRMRVSDLLDLHERFDAALSIDDSARRAESLEPFLLSDLFWVKETAFDEMQKCGNSALPVLLRMLADESLLRLHREVVESLGKVGGKEVGERITRLVLEELDFWRATAPLLKPGWSNEVNEPERNILLDRYGKLYQAVCSLTEMRFAGCKEAVSELRDFWRSFPQMQMEDSSGVDHMSQVCDEILRGLP